MENYDDLDNKYLIAVFKKHLYRLESKGFRSKEYLPIDNKMSLKLAYSGPLIIEIVREFRCNVYMDISPINLKEREETFTLSQLVFTLSNRREYLGDIFNNIGCYYLDYEENIQKICDSLFKYYESIVDNLRPENLATLKKKLEKDEVQYLIRSRVYPPGYDPNRESGL